MAATTTWHDRMALTTKSWLLANGEEVQQPPLEETTSGRKVRIKGTTVSAFSRDIDDLIYQGVQAIAAKKQTRVWMALDETMRRQLERNVYDSRITKGVKPSLHLLTRNPSHSKGMTTVWWRFRHATLPVEALIVVQMSSAYSGYGRSNTTNQDMQVALFMPSPHAADAEHVNMVHCVSPDLSDFGTRSRDSGERQRWREFVRDTHPNWWGDFTPGQRVINGDRAAVKDLLATVMAVDAFDTIDVPDLRDPANPAWLPLDLQDTNLTGEFLQTLRDYLDGDGVVEQIKQHWDEIARLFASSGLILEEKTEADFSTALAGGDPVTIKVESPPNEAGNGYDHQHSVTLHLPTGTMIVNCATRAASKDEVASKWEEAHIMAQLSGQEDELLAYARQYAKTEHERRAKQILRERKTQ